MGENVKSKPPAKPQENIYEQAKGLIEREEFTQAVSLLSLLAASGDAEAQFLLGSLFFTSAKVDFAESKCWLEKAAAQDHAEATYCLASIQQTDDLVFDEQAYVRLLHRAGELGSPAAQYDLGALYATGDGPIPKDDCEAVRWYSKAAGQGCAEAQYNLGTMLLEGEGTEQNTAGGIALMEQAANNGNLYAAKVLADFYKFGPYGISPDPEKAAYWNNKAGEFKA